MWKQLGESARAVLNASVKINQMSNALADLPDEDKLALFKGRLQEHRVKLEKVYGDKSRAGRLYQRVLDEVAGQAGPPPVRLPDEYALEELAFETQYKAAGEKVTMTYELMEEIAKNPDRWQVRKDRNRA